MKYTLILYVIFSLITSLSCDFEKINTENKRISTVRDTTEKDTTVTGIAQNSKAGGIVITSDNSHFFVDVISSWNDDVLGKMVEVTGTLKKEYYTEKDLKDEEGGWKQGMLGEKLIIINAKWMVVK